MKLTDDFSDLSRCQKVTCVLLAEEGNSVCCPKGYDIRCYNEWEEILELLRERFPKFKEDEDRKKTLFRIEANVQSMSEFIESKQKMLNQSLRCEPELDCASCHAQFECVTARWGATTSGCCPPGTKMACCVKFTTTTTPTTPTTTTTTAMTYLKIDFFLVTF
uniref:Phlebovirus_G2 domain-containing protein n=1 Tax=Globodera pallida TaxID=36090 RepID=A0A183C5P0_GLOPA